MLCELASRFKASQPQKGSNHFTASLGAFRLKWERHTEFTRYMFIVEGPTDQPFSTSAMSAVPADWIASLPGTVLAATDVELIEADGSEMNYDEISRRYFNGNVLVGGKVAGGAGRAFTDYRIGKTGFSRLLVHQISMTPRQAGRMIQRILEIDTYRMLALLALPLARELAPWLYQCEADLVAVTAKMVKATEEDEPVLLDRLTQLEAEMESRSAAGYYRFSAASAYYDLVQRRIAELRESRIEGLQLFQEFMERRLAPAMATCRATAQRQETLSLRVSRATQLLSTKVDITQEIQNSKLLESMNARAKVQLRLQQTVEGLSIAAVTYYVVGLVGYLAKGVKAAGVNFNPDIAMGVSIPVVAAAVAYSIARIKKSVVPSHLG